MDNFTEKTSRMLAEKTSRRGFLGWLGKASVALVGGAVLSKTGQSVNAQGDAPDTCCSGCFERTCGTSCISGKLWVRKESVNSCCNPCSSSNCWTAICSPCGSLQPTGIPC